jgi:glutathione synthase/RimK-type ligase-like ATP-grasp enzyme
MKNSQRVMVKIIEEICSEEGIQCECFSYDWIFRLTKNGKTAHIFGYQFENNSATTQLICTDKCASSEILSSRGIPTVEHFFFISPDDLHYIGLEGNWPRMLELLQKFGRLVCKPNEGTGGIDVFQVSSAAELELAVNSIFAHSRSLALSPFYPIDQEYRVILLNEEVKLVFSKTIQSIIGNGRSSFRQLLLKQNPSLLESVPTGEFSEDLLNKIPKPGEKIPLNWKHNLGQGAQPEIITDALLLPQLRDLALRAAKAVNARFASVDIIHTGGEYKVLEINSGIMMENFARLNLNNYQKAKSIYKEAICSLFNDKNN